MEDTGYLDFIINRLKGITYKEKILLCEAVNNESEIINKSKSDIELIIGRRLEKKPDIESSRKRAENDVEKALKQNIKWVCFRDSDYPPLLREIYDPPIMLFYIGKLPNPKLPLVAIVGTRKPSPKAAAQAYDIAKGLGQNGISVVSGLALGIDSMAHKGNIQGILECEKVLSDNQIPRAASVAVLGSGLDHIYPSSNRNLARQILETGGALISEYTCGVGPRKWTFPARNRIISGISRGVLIVEAPKKSGALITAGFALEQNREVWVSSAGSIAETDGRDSFYDRRGTIKLAEEGAVIVNSEFDILKEWKINKE